jgi:glycosyltransferase involved in cell wall biosynthesis
MIHWAIKRADLYLAETKHLVDVARRNGIERVRWFSNSRPMPPLPATAGDGGETCTRFVYLGQVRRCKGIPELIEAGECLEEPSFVDVYGPLGFDVPESAFAGLTRVRYRGVVEPGRVLEVLSGYDALVLPTRHHGEGYPGVVLEAFAAGLPVVVTRWRALPEIVDESCGVLIPVGDAQALAASLRELATDADRYSRLRGGVRERRGRYSDSVWHDRFVDYCREAAGGGPTDRGEQ